MSEAHDKAVLKNVAIRTIGAVVGELADDAIDLDFSDSDDDYDDDDDDDDEEVGAMEEGDVEVEKDGNENNSGSGINAGNVATAALSGLAPRPTPQPADQARMRFVPEKAVAEPSTSTKKSDPVDPAARQVSAGPAVTSSDRTSSNARVNQPTTAGRSPPVNVPVKASTTTKQAATGSATGSQTAAPAAPAAVPMVETTTATTVAAAQPSQATTATTSTVAAAAASKKTTPNKAAKADLLGPTAAAPYGYKLVKVKKPDGTIVQVKRPRKAEEAAKAPAPVTAAETKAAAPTIPAAETTAVPAQASTAQVAPPQPPKPIVDRPTSFHAQATTGPVGSTAAARPTHTSEQPAQEKSLDIAAAPALPKGTLPYRSKEAATTIAEMQTDHGITSSPTSATAADEKKGVHVTEKEIDEKAVQLEQAPKSKVHHISTIMKYVTWTVMIIFPLVFIGLGIAAAVLNNHEVPHSVSDPALQTQADDTRKSADKKDALNQAITVAVSMWPIVFAAIMAQTLRSFAAWKVERGVPLVTLEQLISSHSVGGAIKQPFMLRTFNVTTIVLLVLWCLSPLAGQAIVRMVTTPTYSNPFDAEVRVIDPVILSAETPGGGEFGYDGQNDIYGLSQIDAIYSTLLIGSDIVQGASIDLFSNVKIPLLTANISDSVEGLNPDAKDSLAGLYSSLLGVPVWVPSHEGVVSTQYTDFDINSTYYTMNCSAFERHQLNSAFINSLNMSHSPTETLYLSAVNDTASSYNLDGTDTNTTIYEPGPRGVLHFAAVDQQAQNTAAANRNSSGVQLLYSRCEYDQVAVRSFLYCTDVEFQASCYVWQQEKINNPPAGTFAKLGYKFVQALVNSAGAKTKLAAFTDTESYLADPLFSTGSNQGVSDSYPELANVTATDFSTRFARIVSTFSLLGSGHEYFLNLDLMRLNDVYGGEQPFNLNVTANFSGNESKYYELSWGWWSCLMICGVLLLIAAGIAAFLERRTIGPDFLGFANTAIKKNVKLNKEMRQLDARQRLRALQECEVLLQDVKPDAQVGKIALGINESNAAKLVRGRQYK